eukprot:jgi/Chrpa1/11886/Chrysochromulina_OHIO_Genome00006103-RA
MEAAVNSARRRLLGLEDRIPWNAVKKSWAATQQKWKNIVTSALDFNALAQELLVLESMLTSNSMAPDWQSHKAAWIMRVKQCAGPAVLEQLVGVLENTIQWHRILVAPDGRPLSAEELASGQFGVGGFPPTPLPPPLSLTLTARANGGAGSSGAASPSTVPDPPDGVPRAAARMQMLLLAMGAKDYDPKVVVQLLDVMYVWTASVLNDASLYARMRVLGSDSATRQHTLQLAMAAEPPIEEVDVVLAVRGRAEHLWTSAAARDVIAQQAADINTEPMPILPRQPVVTLPTDLSQCLPGARALLRRGLDVEEEDEEEAPCWALDAHGLYSAAASGTLPTVPSAPAAAPWGHAAPPAPAAPWGAVGAAPVPCIHTHTHTVPPGGAVPGAVGAAPVPPGGAVPGGLLPPQGAQHGAAGYPVVPKLPAPQQQPRPGGGVGGVAVPSRPGDAKRQRAR